MGGEAAAISVYILNKCPAKRLSKMVPKEKSIRRKPTVSHLSVFCALCATVIYLSKEEQVARQKQTYDLSWLPCNWSIQIV